MAPEPDMARSRADQSTHFMVRVYRPDGDPLHDLSGVVELLSTGERRAFGSGPELLLHLGRWAAGATGARGPEERAADSPPADGPSAVALPSTWTPIR